MSNELQDSNTKCRLHLLVKVPLTMEVPAESFSGFYARGYRNLHTSRDLQPFFSLCTQKDFRCVLYSWVDKLL